MKVQMWMVNEHPVALSPARWMLLSFIKDAHSLEKSGRYCLWSAVSNCSFAFSSSKLCPRPGHARARTHTHTHTHSLTLSLTHGCLFGRSFLFVQHRVLSPWLPSVESFKSWCGRQKRNSTQAEEGTAGDWLCGDVDVVWLYLPVLWKALLWGCEGEKPRDRLEASFQLAVGGGRHSQW